MYGLKKKYIEVLKKHGCKCRADRDDNNGWMYNLVTYNALGYLWVCDLGRKGERPKIYKFTDEENGGNLYLVDARKKAGPGFGLCDFVTTKNLKDFEEKLVETLDYINDFKRRNKIFKMKQKLKRIEGDFV
jgi:hypothetical protein